MKQMGVGIINVDSYVKERKEGTREERLEERNSEKGKNMAERTRGMEEVIIYQNIEMKRTCETKLKSNAPVRFLLLNEEIFGRCLHKSIKLMHFGKVDSVSWYI
jgi:hypothetical protein